MTAITQELSFQFYLVVSNELRMFLKKNCLFFGHAGSSLPHAGSFSSFAVSEGLVSSCCVWAAHYAHSLFVTPGLQSLPSTGFVAPRHLGSSRSRNGYNQSDFGIDHLVMRMYRVSSFVVEKGCLL